MAFRQVYQFFRLTGKVTEEDKTLKRCNVAKVDSLSLLSMVVKVSLSIKLCFNSGFYAKKKANTAHVLKLQGQFTFCKSLFIHSFCCHYC